MSDLRTISSNPHVRSRVTTSNIMFWVVVALLPAALLGVINFGLDAAIVLAISVATTVLTELIYEKLMKKPVTIGDYSAVVTGLLLGMNLPSSVPWFIPVLGGVFAILAVKMVFGGLGQNFMNPALGGRCFLLISFTGYMTTFPAPNEVTFLDRIFNISMDAYTGATPLAQIKAGETVNVFAKCLSGVEFKLRVLLNKCDAFSSVYDFARTYGTVCWNLARVLHTKDLPKIWTVYSGDTRDKAAGELCLADFNQHREEFISVFRDAEARRRDNVFSQAMADFCGLSIRMCVVNHAARKIMWFCVAFLAFGAMLSVASAALVKHVVNIRLGEGSILAIAAGVLAACCGLFLSYVTMRLAVRFVRGGLAGKVDDIFAVQYRHRIAVGTDDAIRQAWNANREETAEVIRSAPLKLPFFGELCRRKVDSVAAKILAVFKKMGN